MQRRSLGHLQFCGATANPLHRDGLPWWWQRETTKEAVPHREQLRLAMAYGQKVTAQGNIAQKQRCVAWWPGEEAWASAMEADGVFGFNQEEEGDDALMGFRFLDLYPKSVIHLAHLMKAGLDSGLIRIH
ncbi:hypothetical protein COCNU_scaffold013556G000020 [Cocos nucifera]|nr:hypothetical protein [Cocos nucifera]